MGLNKDRVVTVATGLAGLGIGAGVTLAAFRAAETHGIHHIVKLVRRREPLVHRAELHDFPDREQVDLESIRGMKIIYLGDSQGLPTDKRVTTSDGKFTPYQPGAMDACARDELNDHYGLGITAENYGRPGQITDELVSDLRNPESRAYKALVGDEEQTEEWAQLRGGSSASTEVGIPPADKEDKDPDIYLIVAIGPNNWQIVPRDYVDLAAIQSLGAPQTDRRLRDKTCEGAEVEEQDIPQSSRRLRDRIQSGITIAGTVASTVLGLGKGHEKVGNDVKDDVVRILEAFMDINRVRVARGKKPLKRIGFLCPANFGEAFAITVGEPGKEETTTIEIEGNELLIYFGSMVSSRSGGQIEKAMNAREWEVAVDFVSSEGVVFPRPDETTKGGKVDQHLGYGPNGVKRLGKNLGANIAHTYGKPKKATQDVRISQVA